MFVGGIMGNTQQYVVTIEDFDEKQFDVTNKDGSNKIKIKENKKDDRHHDPFIPYIGALENVRGPSYIPFGVKKAESPSNIPGSGGGLGVGPGERRKDGLPFPGIYTFETKLVKSTSSGKWVPMEFDDGFVQFNELKGYPQILDFASDATIPSYAFLGDDAVLFTTTGGLVGPYAIQVVPSDVNLLDKLNADNKTLDNKFRTTFGDAQVIKFWGTVQLHHSTDVRGNFYEINLRSSVNPLLNFKTFGFTETDNTVSQSFFADLVNENSVWSNPYGVETSDGSRNFLDAGTMHTTSTNEHVAYDSIIKVPTKFGGGVDPVVESFRSPTNKRSTQETTQKLKAMQDPVVWYISHDLSWNIDVRFY